MPAFNKVILAGNMTRAPETAYLPSGLGICKFGLAVNRKWKDKDGGAKEEVLFVDCAVFGKSAEVLQQYTSKGSPILVEGRLRLESWDGKDGQKHSKHTVVVDNFQFLGKKPDESAPPQEPEPPRTTPGRAIPEDGIPF